MPTTNPQTPTFRCTAQMFSDGTACLELTLYTPDGARAASTYRNLYPSIHDALRFAVDYVTTRYTALQ